MTTVRYIKNLLPYSITLHTGHNINPAIVFEPYEVKPYINYIEDNLNSPNYNKYLFDDYVKEQLISLIIVEIKEILPISGISNNVLYPTSYANGEFTNLIIPLTLLGVGIFNEASNWEFANIGTANYPGPYGLSDATRYFTDFTNNWSFTWGNVVWVDGFDPIGHVNSQNVYLRAANDGTTRGTQFDISQFMGVMGPNIAPNDNIGYTFDVVTTMTGPDIYAIAGVTYGGGEYLDFYITIDDGAASINIPFRYVFTSF